MSLLLTHAHIAHALARSQDNGATLDFTKQDLTELPEDSMQDLAALGVQVTRLALANNHLSTLPMRFALLSRLRYLNLKHNSFSVFPDVLAYMPGLDTLDISCNKIKRLPSDPGYLVQLRVFVFSRNKIQKLPPYLAKFRKLAVLKADRNPMQWPPAHIMDVGQQVDDMDGMKMFVRRVQAFLDEECPAGMIRATKSVDSGFGEFDDSFGDEEWKMEDGEQSAAETPHARSFSVDSSFSMSSIAESVLEVDTSYEEPPKLRLGMLKTLSMNTDASQRSPDSYLPSPAESCFAVEDQDLVTHSRGISYAGRRSPLKEPSLMNKSLPDLRTARLNFTKKTTTPPPPTSASTSTRPKDESMPSPLSLRQDSSSSAGSSNPRVVPPLRSKLKGHGNPSPTRHAVHSVDFERNSYFNRLSTLPTSTSPPLPDPLVRLVDSARTILFTLSQAYQAFDQFTIYTADDRLPTVLRKVLDPASADMMHLICSLDRFDALSRKVVPPPSACRNVVECCRDTVSAFGKALGVLMLQLKVLEGEGERACDVRYLRQMRLVLYGAAAEISFMWQTLSSHLEAIKPLLRSKVYPASSSNRSASDLLLGSSPPKQQQHGTLGGAAPRMLRHPNGDVPDGRIRMTRRHAGSFSSKDVEIGKSLPSYDLPVHLMRRRFVPPPVPHTPTMKGSEVTLGDMGVGASWDPSHSRGGSQVSIKTSSESSNSPSLPTRTPRLDQQQQQQQQQQASTSKSQVDKEALQALKDAVDVAPVVWDAVDDILLVVDEDNSAVLKDCLERARGVTKRLKDAVRFLGEGGPGPVPADTNTNMKGMKEDANLFLKVVIQLSNIIKVHGTTHSVAPALRTSLARLTNSTEQCAILLHVSSFSSLGSLTPTPIASSHMRSFSPMTPHHPHPHPQMGGGPPQTPTPLAPSLSRSRSAQAAIPTINRNHNKVMMGPPLFVHDAPKSAQLVSTFRAQQQQSGGVGLGVQTPTMRPALMFPSRMRGAVGS